MTIGAIGNQAGRMASSTRMSMPALLGRAAANKANAIRMECRHEAAVERRTARSIDHLSNELRRVLPRETTSAFKEWTRAGKSAEKAVKFLQIAQKHANAEIAASNLFLRHLAASRQLGDEYARALAVIGDARAKARLGSKAAESALTFMEPHLNASREAWKAAHSRASSYQSVMAKYSGSPVTSIGKFARDAERLMEGNAAGRLMLQSGRVLNSKMVSQGLKKVGWLATALDQHNKSPFKSGVGRIIDSVAHASAQTVVSGAISTAVMAGRMSPAALVFDPAVTYGARAIGLGDMGEKLTIGKLVEGTVAAFGAVGSAIVQGDSAPADVFHERSMRGDYGYVYQGWSAIGQTIADTGVVADAFEAGADFCEKVSTSVSNSFQAAGVWWDTVDL